MKLLHSTILAATLPLLAGCSQNSPPVMMAPPTTPVTINQQGGQDGQGQLGQQGGQAYNWTEVPTGQQVPIQRAVFDQGGYQMYSQQGTIVVPFANQNLYVMKFGRSTTGGMYFVNNGQFPTLYIPAGASLENAAQPGARWYPFPQNYAYTQPVYVGLAPSWSAFSGMGWSPGMSYYGGYYGYSPYSMIGPMIGLHFLIGGMPYYGWNSYHNYYSANRSSFTPMRVVNRTVYNQAARTSFNGGAAGGKRAFGSSGSTFGGTRSFGGNSSFGGARPFGSNRPSGGGSFGSGRSGFGTTAPRSSGGSFGSAPSGYGGSFGSGRRSFPSSGSGGSFGSRTFGGGSFGGGSAPASRPSGGFFGSGGGSFGGSRSSGGGSFGGGSFGGGRSPFLGGGRRR